jgi:hypothetical protein
MPRISFTATTKATFSAVLSMKDGSPRPGMTIYLNDVPKIHVDAFKPKIAGNQDNSGGIDGVTFNDALDVVAKLIPKELAAGYTSEQLLDSRNPFRNRRCQDGEDLRLQVCWAGEAGHADCRVVYRVGFEGHQWCQSSVRMTRDAGDFFHPYHT